MNKRPTRKRDSTAARSDRAEANDMAANGDGSDALDDLGMTMLQDNDPDLDIDPSVVEETALDDAFTDEFEDELTDEDHERVSDALVASDDPVRMYLKEIGQVPLLDHNHETWLSSQIAALTLLKEVRAKVAEAQALSDGQLPSSSDVLHLLYELLLRFWSAATDAAQAQGVESPDLLSIAYEARALHQQVNLTLSHSYVREYLDGGEWGHDESWKIGRASCRERVYGRV